MRKFIFILVLILIAPICLCGCLKQSNNYKEYEQERFCCVERYNDIEGTNFCIVVDKQTRIMYLAVEEDYTYRGIAPLLDENGNPQRYEGDL